MSIVIDTIGDIVSGGWDFFVDATEWAFDNIVIKPVEKAFNLIGIKDETVVLVDKVSVKIQKDDTTDLIQDAKTKAALSLLEQGGSFFDWYEFYKGSCKAQIRAYYNIGNFGGYIHGLPEMDVRAGDVDLTAIDNALTTEVGGTPIRLSVTTLTPSEEIHFKNEIQSSPYFYKPWNNTLTFTDPYGIVRTDYKIDNVTYNVNSRKYEITIYRTAVEAVFTIVGPSHIVEGDNATYTIKCNRTVPIGESVKINLSYSGTLLSRRYQHIPSVILTSGNDEVSFIVRTDENTEIDTDSTLIVSIENIENTNAAFEAVSLHTISSVTTTVRNDEGIILTMSSHTVAESAGTVVIPVKLESATAAPFSVNFSTLDGTALAGSDYQQIVSGTLNYDGLEGEIQYITVTIYSDAPDDNETFSVYLHDCTDPAVDISQTATILITDGTDIFATPGSVNLTDKIYKPSYIRKTGLVVTYHQSTDPSTEWYYWIYTFSDETYPNLTEASIITNLELLPFAIIKEEDGAVNEDKTTPEYLTTKMLLNKLNLKVDDLISALADNADYQYVNTAYINFSLSPSDNIEIVSKGLWLSFYELVVVHTMLSNSNEFIAKVTLQSVNNAIVWTEHSYNTGISGTLPNDQEYYHEIELIEEQRDGEGNIIVEAESILHIRYQTSAGIYSEINIHNLTSLSTIYKNGLYDVATAKVDETKFTVPISYYVIKNINPNEYMFLHRYSLRLDIYSADIVYLDWYETSAFATFFEMVSIVITILSIGSATSFLAVLKQLLFQWFIIQLVVIIAVETGNANLAALVGLVAMFAFADSGSILDNFNSAEDLLLASTNFVDNIGAAAEAISDELKEELTYINETAERRLKEIEELGREKSEVSVEFLAAIKSVDTHVYPAHDAQYDFNLLFDYDRLIKDYYDLNLKVGAI